MTSIARPGSGWISWPISGCIKPQGKSPLERFRAGDPCAPCRTRCPILVIRPPAKSIAIVALNLTPTIIPRPIGWWAKSLGYQGRQPHCQRNLQRQSSNNPPPQLAAAREVIENPQHIQDLLRTRKRAQLDKQAEVFLSMGEVAKTFLEGLGQSRQKSQSGHQKVAHLARSTWSRNGYPGHADRAPIPGLRPSIMWKILCAKQNRTVCHLEPIQLKDQKLNHLHLQETDLLIYDAIALKKRKKK